MSGASVCGVLLVVSSGVAVTPGAIAGLFLGVSESK
jgi:hypothetical protein